MVSVLGGEEEVCSTWGGWKVCVGSSQQMPGMYMDQE